MDSSVRFITNISSLQSLEAFTNQSCAALLFSRSSNTNYEFTHAGMYKYIPTNELAQKTIYQYQAGVQLMYRTHHTIEHIYKWIVLCALDPDCVAPRGSKKWCTFKLDVQTECHRYDQSLINLLLSNVFNFTVEKYVYQRKILKIKRKNYGNISDVIYCKQ